MSAGRLQRIRGWADARRAASVTDQSMLSRAIQSCGATLRSSASFTACAAQPPPATTLTSAAPPAYAGASTAEARPANRSHCTPAHSSLSNLGRVHGSATFRGSSGNHMLPPAAAACSQPRRMIHASAGRGAAQAAPIADATGEGSSVSEDPLFGAPGDPQLADMIEPQFLDTRGGRVAYHALPATGSHLTGVIYCGGEARCVLAPRCRLAVPCWLSCRQLQSVLDVAAARRM